MMRRWRPIAGLAAAVVPPAVLVHLAAEGLAVGRAGLTAEFVLRHVYLAALVGLSLWVFGRTVGLGSRVADIRRRTALLRSALSGRRRPAALAMLVAANLAFFTLTQAGEGVPILSGALWLGLAAGVAGSLLSAVLVYAFGRSLLAAAVAAVDWKPRRARIAMRRRGPVDTPRPRTAATSFSLFVPNRPPPMHPFLSFITLLEGIHSCSALFARRVGRPHSFLELRIS